MKCIVCDRDDQIVGILTNERLICSDCWKLTHKLLGVEV
jgi:hypothetical protein